MSAKRYLEYPSTIKPTKNSDGLVRFPKVLACLNVSLKFFISPTKGHSRQEFLEYPEMVPLLALHLLTITYLSLNFKEYAFKAKDRSKISLDNAISAAYLRTRSVYLKTMLGYIKYSLFTTIRFL